jgi:hypothetical protein
VRRKKPDCGATIAGLDEHASASCEKTECASQCETKCDDGYTASSATYECANDGTWKPRADAIVCSLLLPVSPFVESVTSENGSLSVVFRAESANQATYTVTASVGPDVKARVEVQSAPGTVTGRGRSLSGPVGESLSV